MDLVNLFAQLFSVPFGWIALKADLRTFRLPNSTTYPMLLLGLINVLNSTSGYDLAVRLVSVLPLLVVGAGMGDVKLLSALVLLTHGLLPCLIILPVASLVAMGVTAAKFQKRMRIPFGPYLISVSWAVWSIEIVSQMLP